MSYEEYLKNKVFEYCDAKVKRGASVNTWDVYQVLGKKDFWNLSAVLFGKWLQENSTGSTTELSEQEW
jgi:hypothetical protein